MIKCSKHGLQDTVQVSPDAAESILQGESIKSLLTVQYVFDGDVVDQFFVTQSVATKNELSNELQIPLPDDYPDWVLKMVPICAQCKAESEELA